MDSYSKLLELVNTSGCFAPANHMYVTELRPDHSAVGVLEVQPSSLNPMGIVHGGALVTLCALILTHLGLGSNLEMVTAGAVVPLLPGVAFTNGIRDIADEDYISGSVRLLDAVLVVACLALGVGAVMAAYTAWGV